MGKIIFILGGARSGKSSFALKLAKKSKKTKVAFIATGEARDNEMKQRILFHRRSRPSNFKTFEQAHNLSGLLKKIASGFDVIIIDCLTLFVSNLLLKKYDEKKIANEISKMLTVLKKTHTKAIIVSNEVGLGIVPQTKLGRDFRDIAGKVNQVVAQGADNVFFMVSGLPWRVK
ncbi:MAG: bifunctional adenosylcobinamide kinase/adenosylcobinamide-phosphate guanylyltransferase [Candidatus Omnitrophica bacterium]|jgi:adenosylcobinamide kinase/adenosylcobinamide-phosphate guanylyltransferase|nr:bifunctional adenosylcobinamide kinase/adenosylcobinamide-phosphate guanylyltransferase [Candidatus Omnitrophota bacterium]